MRIKTNVTAEKTLEEYMNDFIRFKKANKSAKRTISDYQKTFSKFILTSHNSMNFEILMDDILKFFSNIPDTSATVYNIPYSNLNAFFNWCVRLDYLPSNPIKKQGLTKRKDETTIHSATLRDVKKLLDACDKNTFTGFRNYVMILVMIDTGIRTCELFRLTNSDYDPAGRTILVRKEYSKTHQERICYLSDNVVLILNRFLRVKPTEIEWLFPSREGNQFSANYMAREFRNLSAAAGVKVTPYMLRHTFATEYVAAGGNVFVLQKLMGHSDLRMTLRYTDINEYQKKEAHEAFSPINQLTPKKRLSL